MSSRQPGEYLVQAIDTDPISGRGGPPIDFVLATRSLMPHLQPVELGHLIKEVCVELADTFRERKQTLKIDLTALPRVKADQNLLKKLFHHLIRNAAKFTPNEGIITVTGHHIPAIINLPNGGVEIIITDTGVGMDDAVRLRIFEPFYTTKGTQGTGLGLAVVYGIVQAHGGFIDVSTEQHKGTTFRLYLPAQMVDEAPVRSPVPRYLGAEKDIENRNKVVLVVEDENYMLLLIKKLLEAKGYGVITATDGEQALELYGRHKDEIAVIILDLGLPKIPGREVFLKMKEATPDLPVIVASGYLYPEVKTALFKQGVKALVEKPYNPEALLEAVAAALRRSAGRQGGNHQFLP